MDARPIPPRPNLRQYKKQAKELLEACKSDDPAAIRAWARNWMESWAEEWVETQARLSGMTVTPDLRARIDSEVDRVAQHIRSKLAGSEVRLADAQFFIARAHAFESWPKFARHIEGLTRAKSPVAEFEAAVDAIVAGDVTTLERLVRENPELIRARSNRTHEATLLHYVSANGVEDFRQKTPKNAVEIALTLLRAGADANAVSKSYGGSTTLGLVATSIHPARAGVQIALMEALLDAGAIIDAPDGACAVNGCLANGHPEAAQFLARRGARLDLEGAAGVGRLDLVKSFFEQDASLKSNAEPAQIASGFMWACEFGQTAVAEFLLEQGLDAGTAVGGMTGLHWAAVGGHRDIIELLLRRNAPLEARNSHVGTVLGQTTWAVVHSDPVYRWPEAETDWAAIVKILLDAGADVEEADYPTGNAQVDEVLRGHGAT